MDVVERTAQKTNEWLYDVMQEVGVEDRHEAYLCLRAVMHELRDRLTVKEAAQLGAQLPMLVRGFYYEGWKPSHKPEKMSKEEFIERLKSALPGIELDAENVARGVFRSLSKQVTQGEIDDVKHLLPSSFHTLWPEA